MERWIDPTIGDLQREHADAQRSGALWTAGWVRLRGIVSVASLLAYAAARDAFHAITYWSASDAAYLRQSSIVFLVATFVATVLFACPQVLRYRNISDDVFLLTLYLIPSILPLSTALAGTLAIACGRRERLTKKVAAAILAAAFACSVAMFADLAWIVPDSNQAFREVTLRRFAAPGELVFAEPLARGDNEMSLSELRRQIALQPDRARRLAFTYHLRWSLAFAPLVLAGLAVLLVRSIKRTAMRTTIAFVLCAGYWVVLGASRAAMSSGYPIVVSAWLPNLVFFAFSLIAAALGAWRSKTSLLRALIS
jgi:lipopolysaccharide export system permease LptF/LptG-like protein